MVEAMDDDTLVLRDDDPRAGELLAAGHVIVATSWGARLHVESPDAAARRMRMLLAAVGDGYRTAELDASWDEGIAGLEARTHADYPVTPATANPLRDAAAIGSLRAEGMRFFGAVIGEELVAVTAIRSLATRAETEFTSVAPAHRRRGLAAAVKAASVLAMLADGRRSFGTGGAQVNAASLAMNARLGYEVTERWLALRAPG